MIIIMIIIIIIIIIYAFDVNTKHTLKAQNSGFSS